MLTDTEPWTCMYNKCTINIVHDLCSSFESKKNVSDLTVIHNQCKPCGRGEVRQGANILVNFPRGQYMFNKFS